MSIIYISHRLEEVFRIADVVTVLKDGQLVETESIHELTRAELIKMMVGRTLEEVFPVSNNQPGKPVLIAENISTDTVLEQVSLSKARRNRRTGWDGRFRENGAGKSPFRR